MSKDVVVFVECKEDSARKVSLELLSKGKELAEKVSSSLIGVIIGYGITPIGEEIKNYADKVILIEHEELKDYRWDTYVAAMEHVMRKYEPWVTLGGSTMMGKDLFPRLAARLDAGIVCDALGISVDEGMVKIRKPLFGGRIISWMVGTQGSGLLLTFRPNSFAVEHRQLSGEIIRENIEILRDPRINVLNVERAASKNIDLQEADFIICGGRGMKGPEHFRILEEIAEVMGGRVGASRAVVDSKWRDYDDQIGKSGKSVSPKIYIGCGVSGALHHTMGMDTSKVIVAINKDANAPIFQYADYGIVDDLFTILPILKEELKKVKEKG